MNEPLKWTVPKWPFWTANVILIAAGLYFATKAPHAIQYWEIFIVCVVAGAGVGIIPYILDYRAMGKVIEVNALGTVADKIENLDQFSAQITAATGRWAAVQESLGENAEKTAAGVKQLAEKMNAEVRNFAELMKNTTDGEKSALRLEVEKFRRGEGEWVQTVIRILDHTFALHVAAVHSNQPRVAEQINQFQNACHSAVRRVGLNGILAQPNDPFDATRHQAVNSKEKPADGAAIAETVANGYSFQGKLVRPALVRLRDATATAAPSATSTPTSAPAPTPTPAKAPAPGPAPAPVTNVTPAPAPATAPATTARVPAATAPAPATPAPAPVANIKPEPAPAAAAPAPARPATTPAAPAPAMRATSETSAPAPAPAQAPAPVAKITPEPPKAAAAAPATTTKSNPTATQDSLALNAD